MFSWMKCLAYCSTKKLEHLSLLRGKMSQEKKSALLNGVWVLVKNILSLLAGKIGYHDLTLQKTDYVFDFRPNPVQKRRSFFLLGNPT